MAPSSSSGQAPRGKFGPRSLKGDYQRPRRPNPESIRYLRSLPLEESLATGDDHDTQASTEALPSSFIVALSALDEIYDEFASLAGDEHASSALEAVVRCTAPYSAHAARLCLSATAGYAVFLATHRYGSHVLQTVLREAWGVNKKEADQKKGEDWCRHPDAPALRRGDALPSLTDALLVLHAELLPQASILAVHVCGSHILRTLVAVLGGFLPSPSDEGAKRRGGHAKAKTGSRRQSSEEHLLSLKSASSRWDPANDAPFKEALIELTAELTGTSSSPTPGRLQQWACDPSASPLLIRLLRVWTYLEGTIARRNATNNQDPSLHHMQFIPLEPRFKPGSQAHALANRLLCWQAASTNEANSDEVVAGLPQGGPHAADVIYGLAGEPRGSHVLDTVLRLASDDMYTSILEVGGFLSQQTLREYIEHDVSNFVVQTVLATVRRPHEAVQLSELLQSCAAQIVDATQRRRGILWRWAEMAVQFANCQPLVIEGLAGALHCGSSNATSNAKLSKTCASSLLGIPGADAESDRLVLNVEGSRALYHLLCFQAPHSKGVVESLLALSPIDLERLAKDGLGSRCVWDAVLDEEKAPTASWIRPKLLSKLKGRWLSLATDRVGHHVVRQMFVALPHMSSREVLVQELVGGIGRLEGNTMGRKIASLCRVRDYSSRGKAEWERAIRKDLKEKEWLQDIIQSPSNSASGTSKSSFREGWDGKRRHRESPETSHDKSKRIKEMSMRDIVAAIATPQKR